MTTSSSEVSGSPPSSGSSASSSHRSSGSTSQSSSRTSDSSRISSPSSSISGSSDQSPSVFSGSNSEISCLSWGIGLSHFTSLSSVPSEPSPLFSSRRSRSNERACLGLPLVSECMEEMSLGCNFHLSRVILLNLESQRSCIWPSDSEGTCSGGWKRALVPSSIEESCALVKVTTTNALSR